MSRSKRPNSSVAPSAKSSATAPHPRRARPILFRLAALLLGCLVIVVIVEVSLRIAGYEPTTNLKTQILLSVDNPRLKYHCFPENPHGEFEPLPDVSEGSWQLLDANGKPLPMERLEQTPWCVEYRRSSIDLRERELSGHRAAAGQTRIACVGDSFTFGQGVPLEQTLPRQLERQLGSDYQVVNIANTGWDFEEEIRQLEKFRSQQQCSRALFVFLINDLQRSREMIEREQELFELIADREKTIAGYQSGLWVLGPSKICQWIHSKIYDQRIGRQTERWYRDCFDRGKNSVGLDRFQQGLRRLASLKTNREKCQVAMVIYPILRDLEGEYPFAAEHKLVAELATEAGIPVLDLWPTFAGETSSSLWVDPSDQHPNGQAHAKAAAAIAKWLETELPEFLEPESQN